MFPTIITPDIFRIICIIAVFQSLFMSVVILVNRKERYFGNIVLAHILLVFSLVVISYFTTSEPVYQNFIRFHKPIFILRQTALILGPLVYFYILSVFNQKEKFSVPDLLHFLPFIIFSVYLILYYKTQKQFIIWESAIRYYSSALILIQNLVYAILPFIHIKKKHIKLNELFLMKGDPQKFWLSIFIVGFIALWINKFNFLIISDIGKWLDFCPLTNNLYFLTFFILINILWFISLRNPDTLRKIIKYKNNNLSAEKKNKITELLFTYMKEQKPYMNPEISLVSLSNEIGIPPWQLSQIINEQTHKNFNDFINSYRIEESKMLLKKNKHGEKYISDILYSVGFNSRTSFYTAFNKNTGTTPSEFMKIHA